jgi:hypothetical protein
MTCPNCAQPIAVGSKFCTQCGTAIGIVSSPPPPLPPLRDAASKPPSNVTNPQEPTSDGAIQRRVLSFLFGIVLGLLILVPLALYLLHLAEPSNKSNTTSNAATGTNSTLQAASNAPPAIDTTNDTYTAYISCGMDGFENMNTLACFTNHGTDTTLELHNGTAYGLYKVYDLNSIGANTPQGFTIRLQHSFALTAQNASDMLKLGVRIYNNRTRQQVFVKQVSEFGVINVSSEALSN